jgi:hypothetical protein
MVSMTILWVDFWMVLLKKKLLAISDLALMNFRNGLLI